MIAPDSISTTTTAPFLPAMASKATFWASKSRDVNVSIPSLGSIKSISLRSFPLASTSKIFSPKTPLRESSYVFSIPVFPIKYPFAYVNNVSPSALPCVLRISDMFSFSALPTKPRTCENK